MITGFTLLLIYQLVGEVLSRVLGLPVPGPVIGMALLFLTLLLRDGPPEGLQQAASSILQHLSLLFIPAGVGVLLHLHRMRDEWLPLTAAIVVGTMVAMAGSAWLLQWIAHHHDKDGEA